jgi:dTDP-4-dehydrorhamnose reductase
VKFVVLGAHGQLGRDLCPRLPGDVVALTRAQADLTLPESLCRTLGELRPDVVVNCAAYNFVDRAESEPLAAWAVNTWGVRTLASVCRERDCVLVHFSSDYVFGLEASRRTPYRPGDAPGPLSVYGLSKLAGEYVVRSAVARHFIVRTCGLYGAWGVGGKGGNFVETMLRVAAQGKPLRVVDDQECTPSYTVDVAEAVAALLQTQQYGIHHVTNAGSCTWFSFARTIFALAGVQADLTPIASAERQAAAPRPTYSVLECQAGLRPWHEALAAYLRERRAVV